MCFRQGVPCVYQAESDPGVIVTEWPNGVIDRQRDSQSSGTRAWPDGTVETLPADELAVAPILPRLRA